MHICMSFSLYALCMHACVVSGAMAAVRCRPTDAGDRRRDKGSWRRTQEALGDRLPTFIQQRQSAVAFLQGRTDARNQGLSTLYTQLKKIFIHSHRYTNEKKKYTLLRNKCTKHQFIHLLMATFKDLHIENSKNYKRWYCPHHTDCVSVCCWIISPFVIFAVFDVQVLKCCR